MHTPDSTPHPTRLLPHTPYSAPARAYPPLILELPAALHRPTLAGACIAPPRQCNACNRNGRLIAIATCIVRLLLVRAPLPSDRPASWGLCQFQPDEPRSHPLRRVLELVTAPVPEPYRLYERCAARNAHLRSKPRTFRVNRVEPSPPSCSTAARPSSTVPNLDAVPPPSPTAAGHPHAAQHIPATVCGAPIDPIACLPQTHLVSRA